jgi:BirA family transcriptional regulator, biotin operon repressor / biotin---[acetyl-CoA-carboxylase] ligase
MRSLAIDMLRALGANAPRSARELAAACDARVAEVERCLARLGQTGLVTIENGAAHLPAPFDFLDAADIARRLGSRAGELRIELMDACPSTSTALLAEAPRPGARLLLAEEQLAGRGRRGRRWLSCVGTALTMSIKRGFCRPPREIAALPLAAGVAAVRALRALGAADAALKWPNDLLARGAKIGGILIETRLHGRELIAVTGIGINCRTTPGLEARLRRPIAALQEVVHPLPSRNVIAARLAGELLAAFEAFDAHGLPAFKQEWEAMHAYAGQRLRVRLADGRVLAGVADGLAEDGGLRLRTRAGTRAIRSGRVVSARAA